MRKINNILYITAAIVMAGCSVQEGPDSALQADGKTPLVLQATLSSGIPATKAYDATFEDSDVLYAYLRHTTGGTKGSYTVTNADHAPQLVTIGHVLYWDDFSSSSSDDTDLRTAGHGLQSYYGYCYNGGTPTTALNETAGTLGWTVQTDQSTADAVKHSDLLWSEEQETVPYAHSNQRENPSPTHGTITIPYTHAMSEITVTLTAGEGFSGDPLTSTVLKLNNMNTVASLTAPTSTVTSTTPADITMFAGTYTGGPTRQFTAIVAPDTKLKVGEKLLDIANVDDNNYELKITEAMLATDKWATDHTIKTDDGKYIETKPGVNYHLDITVSKTAIEVKATLQDWTTVNAEGTGEIQFPTIDFTITGNKFADASAIYLFQLLADSESDTETKRTNAKYGTHATVSTYNESTDKWTNSPTIYWPNQANTYYFRAMSQSPDAASQGTDVLWGTTPAHATYTQGAAIAPRKNEVPLHFEHAMSKVTFQLETTDDATVTVNNAKVDLTGATIAVSHLATSGTISIEDGAITPASTTMDAITATTAPVTDRVVIPQAITDAAMVTITLADGTTYKLQLNQCVDSGTSTAIGAWDRGKHYTYTLHLEKEQISFRALVKDWDEVTGSGNANLEWD